VGAAQGEADELVVALRGGARGAALERLAAHGAVVETIPQLGVVRLVLPARGRAAEAARALAADPEVRHVEPNRLGRGGGVVPEGPEPGVVPEDPEFGLQWHLDNQGQTGGTVGADIGATRAWAATRGSPDVRVAVLDSGIDAEHPEFAGRLEPGFDCVNEDDDPDADHPHGVQVTGLLAANADNGVEIAGVDHEARILPVKVLDEDNLGTVFDLAEGLVFAADAGADVISMSLVGYPSDSDVLEDALQYARARGAVLIACAGNRGIGDADRSGPGAYRQTIAVGWTDDSDARGAIPAADTASATGRALDLVAPGQDLYTVSNEDDRLFSGCSAATPIVAGMASLLLSLDPTLDHGDVREVLVASAVDGVGPPAEDLPGRDDYFGHGRVDLAAAVVELLPESGGCEAAAGAAVASLVALRRARVRPRTT
jgi:subtilisin family serine protease